MFKVKNINKIMRKQIIFEITKNKEKGEFP
jgi:hypothetical protein